MGGSREKREGAERGRGDESVCDCMNIDINTSIHFLFVIGVKSDGVRLMDGAGCGHNHNFPPPPQPPPPHNLLQSSLPSPSSAVL